MRAKLLQAPGRKSNFSMQILLQSVGGCSGLRSSGSTDKRPSFHPTMVGSLQQCGSGLDAYVATEEALASLRLSQLKASALELSGALRALGPAARYQPKSFGGLPGHIGRAFPAGPDLRAA
jgi:hypothetical protein